MKYILLILLFFFNANTNANTTETPASFKIKEIYMAHPANFHFRVVSDNPGAWHCHNGPKEPAWSFINEADP
ncbi:hypothetical protein [Enterovibrio norvegicus]|uniref:hypothetical protein n=1 Tax=Enterovibrio norvegicus TaxID=188144 RepID=UPI0024B2116E|nr:hypothetical protein [Enterovibrio norvegicus]